MLVCVLLAHLIVWPSDAHARHLLRKGPVISDLTGNIARAAYSTPYSGCDDESCACGVPPELLQDLHGAPLAYVALNVQNTGMASRKLSRPIRASSKEIGMFNNGNNCGRWVEITYQESCVGDESAGASQPPVVCGVDAVFGDPRIYYAPDSKTGIKAYALVADGCADNTYWCRNDVFHLDLSPPLHNDLCGSEISCATSRRVEWKFIDAAPAHIQLPESPQFAWHCYTDVPGYSPLLVYNVNRGVSVIVAEGIMVNRNRDLGQQFMIPSHAFAKADEHRQHQTMFVEVLDMKADSYGVFEISFNPKTIAEECAGGKWAAKIFAGPGQVRPHVHPQGDFKQTKESTRKSVAKIAETVMSDATWSSTLNQMDEHRVTSELFPSADVSIALGDSADAGHSHAMIPPVVPITPGACIPSSSACTSGNGLLIGHRGEKQAVMATGSTADISVQEYDKTASLKQDNVYAAMAMRVLGSAATEAGDDGNLPATHTGPQKIDGINRRGRGREDCTDGDQLQTLNGNAFGTTCNIPHNLEERGTSKDNSKHCQSCPDTGTSEICCGRSLPVYVNDASDNHTDCSEGGSCANRPRKTWGDRARRPLRGERACRPLWGQCGGKYYQGIRCCEDGDICRFLSQWYSQCQPVQL